jgi:hypothetical protein
MGMVSDSGLPAVESANWLISSLIREPCGGRFRAVGFGPGNLVLRTKPGSNVRIEMSASAAPNRPLYWITLKANSDGQVEVTLPSVPDRTVQLVYSGLCGS